MREGRTPDGRQLDSPFMPWPEFSGLNDVEIGRPLGLSGGVCRVGIDSVPIGTGKASSRGLETAIDDGMTLIRAIRANPATQTSGFARFLRLSAQAAL